MSSLYVTLINSSQTLDFGYDTFLVDASGGNITLTIPSAAGDGPNFIVSRIDNSTNTVTIISIDSGSGITINGSSSVTIGAHQNVRLALYIHNWYTVQGEWLV